MKKLNCIECQKDLGEITKGKIRNGTILLCKNCFEKYKMYKDLSNYSKSVGATGDNFDFGDFLKNIGNK